VSISSTFYAHILCQYFGAKNYKAEAQLEKVAQSTFLQKKLSIKMLMKLTTGGSSK